MPETVIAAINKGKIRGIRRKSLYSGKTFYSFLGVPYALPPIGELRFEPPQPLQQWNYVLDAIKEKEDCIQFSMYSMQMIGSENCLHLNVHLPHRPGKLDQPKAVIVFVHGGSLLWGSGSEDVHGSPEFVMHREVVYVTINYRLHVLGFLNLNLPQCRGNMGLKDIVMGLRWVRENIEYLGGDPNNVTLMGSSSGAIIVHALMLSPLTKGLFHKVIMLGMYVFHPFIVYEKDPIKVAFSYAKCMGFVGRDRIELLKFLKKVSATDLMKHLKIFNDSIAQEYEKINPSSPFALTIEEYEQDAFMSKSPSLLIKTTKPLPIIYGICEIENAFAFFSPSFKNYDTLREFRKTYRQNVHSWLHHLDEPKTRIIERKLRNYLKDDNEQLFLSSLMVQQDLIVSEFYDSVANVIHEHSASIPIYIYQFEYNGQLNDMSNRLKPLLQHRISDTRTLHFDDFHYWMCKNTSPNKNDRKIVEIMTKLFANFAKTGDPNDETLDVEWRPTTLTNSCYLRIAHELQLVNGKPDRGMLQFWETIRETYKCYSSKR